MTSSNTPQQRFAALFKRSSSKCSQAFVSQVYGRLSNYYGEPHRHYHTLHHIQMCLDEFDNIKAQAINQDAIEWAIWYHDIIHGPECPDAEQQSADYFYHETKGFLDSSLISRVCGLILCTTHNEPSEDTDQQLMMDIDLSSLCMPWDSFLNDSNNLRLEEPDISDAEYYSKKIAFLNYLLDREQIYYSPYYHTRLETGARKNIRRYLKQIEGRDHSSEA